MGATRLVFEREVEVVAVRVHPEHLVVEHLGGGLVEEHADVVALDHLVAGSRLGCLVDRDLDLSVDLLGRDANRPDLGEGPPTASSSICSIVRFYCS